MGLGAIGCDRLAAKNLKNLINSIELVAIGSSFQL